jgi:hypothetical protein
LTTEEWAFCVLEGKTMQVLHYLPTIEELALPLSTATKLVEYLIEPFGRLDDAKRYWQEYPPALVIINGQDKVASAIASLDGFMKHFVELADINPEFIEPLPEGYQLSLTIINDEGNGLYLIKPTDMNLAEDNTDG